MVVDFSFGTLYLYSIYLVLSPKNFLLVLFFFRANNYFLLEMQD